ncbi:chitinase [Ochrobactrum anthropi]|uniref:glycosyl hydrolase family 18 protein n=1 Tax=Brucella anthropi TaxID=529 RepID=UPI0017C40CD5|nr:glycosyl hydrolase family 18 protein [Brucella anthropi]MBA8862892.1 chitinase [Brucella anthropi]
MNTQVKKRKANRKNVIGYVTQYDAWKDIPGIVAKGGYNQLNIDYSKYTILNFSFFGLAVDGSLHSSDYRNKNIHLPEAVQEPADLINNDIYSSWDRFILFGDQMILWYISDGSFSHQLGYRNHVAGGWVNIHTKEEGEFPLAISNPEGPHGLLKKAKDNGVKVMASLGGWSMSKHFPSVAKDPAKRRRLVADCQRLIDIGFDGIDLDWEFPGGFGMNIVEHSDEDFKYFTILVDEIRQAIGPDHLITAAMATSVKLLSGFEWDKLQSSMDYFNIMTYDINGGWSNVAGHNSPLYIYPGQEGGAEASSLDKTITYLLTRGVSPSKINAGVAFYGRGVVTEGPAALNARTIKNMVNVPPDGPIFTCADYVNWPLNVWDGTPNFAMIVQTTREGEYDGWKYFWDENARVPYLTKENFFLSYDNVRSVGEKAQYVIDKNLAGVIIWTSYGDLQNLTVNSTVHNGKLVESHSVTSVLVDKIDKVFSSGTVDQPGDGNSITVNMVSPTDNDTFEYNTHVKLSSVVRVQNSSIRSATFLVNETEVPAIGVARATVSADEFYFTADCILSHVGKNSVRAVIKDETGAVHNSSVNTFVVKAKPQPVPSTPQLILSNVSASRVDLRWNTTDTDDAIVYDVIRNDRKICEGVKSRNYTDVSLEPETIYNYHVIARDSIGSVSGPSNTVSVNTSSGAIGNGQFPDISNRKIMMGFWHNWVESEYSGSGYRGGKFLNLSLKDIPPAYNVIAVAFMKVHGGSADRIPDFVPQAMSADEFRRQIAALHGENRAVILSLGGADAHIELRSSDEDAFVERIISLTDFYGFDGIDIDLEQSAITALDNQVVIPSALKRVKNHYRAKGHNFIISMAPEFPYLRKQQSYTPYITELEGYYDFIAPQFYNQGGDGIWIDGIGNLQQNNDDIKEDFLFYLTESIVTGTNGYIRIPPEKFLIGLPANNDAAANGYVVKTDDVLNALDRLERKGLAIKGLMTWSVNWDGGSAKDDHGYHWEFISRYGSISGNPVPIPEKPAVPSDLKVTATSTSSISLGWKASESVVSRYNIVRDGALVATSVEPTFTNAGLAPDFLYYFQVQSVDRNENVSELTSPVQGRTDPLPGHDKSWKAGTWYDDDDKVSFLDGTYKCVMQHTSNQYWSPDKALSLWVRA